MNFPIEELRESLKAFCNEEKRPWMEKYMKFKFPFIGVTSPDRSLVLKEFWPILKPKTNHELKEWVQFLWQLEEREYQYVAMELYFRNKKLWTSLDHEFIAFMVSTKSWWDTVDYIAANIAGEFFKLFPETFEKVMVKWIGSNDMWVNRTAIICQLKYRQKTNLEWLEKAILPHTGSKEFFHQKAIGWALRQYAKTDAQWVIDFVERVTLKPLSVREALKHLK